MPRLIYTLEEYEKAMELLKVKSIAEASRITGISYNTLLRWKHGKRKPSLAKFVAEPCNELAYVIGCLFGHAHLIEESCIIYFNVTDKEFGEMFSRAMSKLLNKRYKEPRKSKSKDSWTVYHGSKPFCIWYKRQNLESLKKYIEYDRDTVKHFLRALYDSYGYNYKCEMIHLYNRDINILKYVQYLLKRYFGIISRLYPRPKKLIIIRKRHIDKFLNQIGFSITEKQQGVSRRKR